MLDHDGPDPFSLRVARVGDGNYFLLMGCVDRLTLYRRRPAVSNRLPCGPNRRKVLGFSTRTGHANLYYPSAARQQLLPSSVMMIDSLARGVVAFSSVR